jgi:hypothetical protein
LPPPPEPEISLRDMSSFEAVDIDILEREVRHQIITNARTASYRKVI